MMYVPRNKLFSVLYVLCSNLKFENGAAILLLSLFSLLFLSRLYVSV